MKKWLLGLWILLIIGGVSMANAGDTSCWEGKGTVPTSTYASGIVYGCDGEIPIITIYSGDNSWGITIKAMNEGTGEVKIGFGSDVNAYGSLYQWGNNYPFPNVADTMTPINSGFYSVSAAGYGPGTQSGYYYRDLWINAYNWDSSDNRNLWGGSGDRNFDGAFWGFDIGTFTVINAISRGAMCPEGYHIPSVGERSALLYLWGKNYDKNQGTLVFSSRELGSLNYERDLSGMGNRFSEDIQIPFVGIRTYNSTASLDRYSCYRSSSPFDSSYAREFCLDSNDLRADYETGRGYGNAVRCFKNSYVKPSYSLTFNSQGGSEVNTGIAEENTPRTRPENPTKSGYTLVDWYTSTGYDTVFDFTTLATGDLTVYAKWHDNRCGTTDLTLDYDEDNELCYKKDTTYAVPVYYGTDMNGSHSYNGNPIGTITVKLPDGNTLTMMDMNLGATVSGITSASYGDYYQWGNNTPFSNSSAVNTGTHPELFTGTKNIYENYRPGHLYNSELFRYGSGMYDYRIDAQVGDTTQQYFNNLWGGLGDKATTSIDTFWGGINNGETRQGPCPAGYHVPSIGEWNTLLTYRYNARNSTAIQKKYTTLNSISDSYFQIAFRLPFAGYRSYNKTIPDDQGLFCYYWSSSSLSSYSAHNLYLGQPNYVSMDFSSYRASGRSLRCFKDSPKAPETLTVIFDENGGKLLGTTIGTLDQLVASGHLVQQPVNPTKAGATFQNWTKSQDGGDVFNFNIGLNSGIMLYAQYICNSGYIEIDGECVELYTITYNLNEGILSGNGKNLTGYTIKSEDITLINPTKTGYTFTGRSGTELNSLTTSVTIPTGSTGDREYEANWEAITYTITFNLGDESINITGDYGSPVTPPSNPTKNGYRFVGWEPEVPATMPAEDITISAKWERNGSSGGGGGGGGGGSSSSKTDTGSVSSQTGNQINSNTGDIASTGTNVKEPETNTGNSIQTGSQVDSNTGSIVSSGTNVNNPDTDTPGDSTAPSQNDKTYSTEFQEAYEFAKGNGITTMPTIQKANMEGKLTRIAMAKMLSQYAINVLGKTPDATQNNKFNDVTDKLDSDYDDGVTLAYQLGIMGQNMPGNNFRPNDEVTRAEFATALSRMAYGTSDGEYKATSKYYVHHMEKLVKEGIITNDDPNMKELRGYVMIMLMRSTK